MVFFLRTDRGPTTSKGSFGTKIFGSDMCPDLVKGGMLTVGQLQMAKEQHQRWLELLCCNYLTGVEFRTGHY